MCGILQRSRARAVLVATFAIAQAITLVIAPASAQTDEEIDPWSGVEEMTVTSSSVSSLLSQAEGTSVLAFDADALQGIGVADVSDLANYTPNLEIRTPGGGVPPQAFD